MRQASVIGDQTVLVEDVPPPRPGAGEVLVQPRFVGLCGSDVHIFDGSHPGVERPIVLGHEFTGVVAQPSPDSPPEGTPVAVIPLFGCGACAHCRRGEPYICLRREVMGIHRTAAMHGVHLAELDLSRETARPVAFECMGRAESADALFDIVPAPRVAVLVGTYPAAEVYRPLQVRQRFELADIHHALETACSASAGTKVVVRIDPRDRGGG